jgi:hypothetical protein
VTLGGTTPVQISFGGGQILADKASAAKA